MKIIGRGLDFQIIAEAPLALTEPGFSSTQGGHGIGQQIRFIQGDQTVRVLKFEPYPADPGPNGVYGDLFLSPGLGPKGPGPCCTADVFPKPQGQAETCLYPQGIVSGILWWGRHIRLSDSSVKKPYFKGGKVFVTGKPDSFSGFFHLLVCDEDLFLVKRGQFVNLIKGVDNPPDRQGNGPAERGLRRSVQQGVKFCLFSLGKFLEQNNVVTDLGSLGLGLGHIIKKSLVPGIGIFAYGGQLFVDIKICPGHLNGLLDIYQFVIGSGNGCNDIPDGFIQFQPGDFRICLQYLPLLGEGSGKSNGLGQGQVPVLGPHPCLNRLREIGGHQLGIRVAFTDPVVLDKGIP